MAEGEILSQLLPTLTKVELLLAAALVFLARSYSIERSTSVEAIKAMTEQTAALNQVTSIMDKQAEKLADLKSVIERMDR